MARKKLIRGANAARVEERIANPPGDLEGPTIFQLLRAEEPPQGPLSRSPAGEKPRSNRRRAVPAPVGPKEPPREAAQPGAPEKRRGRAAVALSMEERGLLVKACRSYRNSLPTYLRSVQREVALIDGLIGKLSSRPSGQGRRQGP
jgi:hypothetical protein